MEDHLAGKWQWKKVAGISERGNIVRE